ncbi:hypothetical protein RIR_jg37320.t1 [Rhizophagus irregularis DAOM 181602=DAOM 197198]|nr:hypothetical protein RIR_jg37320.t1 [Rhizophagus irregularis DAOM 181602=DAOM 197198]
MNRPRIAISKSKHSIIRQCESRYGYLNTERRRVRSFKGLVRDLILTKKQKCLLASSCDNIPLEIRHRC